MTELHYHIIAAKNWVNALASLRIKNYEDSLLLYTQLSTEFFANMNNSGDLSIDNARLATGNGEAFGAYCGNDSIAFFWMRCEERCASGTWN